MDIEKMVMMERQLRLALAAGVPPRLAESLSLRGMGRPHLQAWVFSFVFSNGRTIDSFCIQI
jgi:hypothetical protein